MTLEEIKALDEPFLWAHDIGPLLGWSPHAIRIEARKNTLPFPVLCHGTRVQIPRQSFLNWYEKEVHS